MIGFLSRLAQHRHAPLLVALLAVLPGAVALACFGMLQTPDTPGYLGYAEQLRAGPLPSGEALLRSAPMPATLFRTIGFPAVLALLQGMAPGHWPALLALMHLAAQAALAALAFRTALAIGLRPWLALLAALMPAAGQVVVAEAMVMTDALYCACFAGAALLLLRAGCTPGGGLLPLVRAGALLGLATLLREATPVLLIGLLPAGAIATGPGPRRRLAGAALLATPALLAALWIGADNLRRSGHAVLSTTKQLVMVQAVLPLIAKGLPVYDGEDLFDRTARETVLPRGYDGIPELNQRLFDAGWTAPEIAAEASARYARTWRRFPLAMLGAMAGRLPVKMFWLTFQPVDTAAELYRQAGEPRPWFGRQDELLRALGRGFVPALPILLLLVLGRAVGLAVTAAAIAAPWLLPKGDARFWPLLGGWLACGALVGAYLPVHLEQRYLIPIVPLLCLLGCLGLQSLSRLPRWRSTK